MRAKNRLLMCTQSCGPNATCCLKRKVPKVSNSRGILHYLFISLFSASPVAYRKSLWSSLCSLKLTTKIAPHILMEKGGWILSADNALPNRPLKMPMSQLQPLPALVSSHKDKASYNFGRIASFKDSFPKAPQPSSCYRYCHIPGNQWEKKETKKKKERAPLPHDF